jgi:DNA-binding MarR family transcriptional regulator
MTGKPSDSAIAAWVGLMRAQARVLGAIEQDLKDEGFPPLAWYDVLLELKRCEAGAARPVELQERLLIAQHNLSRLMDRMEGDGLLERRPFAGDRRGQVIAITEKGRRLQRAMWPTYRTAIQNHIGSKLTETEASRLSELLGKVRRSDD